MSKESTVTPIGGLSWIVRETWDMFVANGVCVELIPPPHPANTMATIKSGPRHKIALRISSSFKRHAKNSERGLLLGRICACILVWAIIAGKEQLVLPSPSILGALASIHATTSFDATVAVPGEIYSRAMDSLSHRN